MFFIGFGLGSVFLPTLSDRYGRKPFFVAAIACIAITFTALVLLPGGNEHYNMVYIFLTIWFINGVQSGLRTAVGYCYFCELAPSKHREAMGTIWNVSEGMLLIWLTLFFWFVSKDWKWTVAFGGALAAVCTFLVVVWFPESPKWLYKEKRYKECQKTLVYMAKINGV